MRRRGAVGVAAMGATAAAGLVLFRRWQLRWGATSQEACGSCPGDDLMTGPGLTATRAISIGLPAAQVWPWIAQLGQGRGGFYSYDFLENLAGCDIHSAGQIVPEWQRVGVGDQVKLAPKVALTVALVQQGRSLVLRGGVPTGSGPPPYDFTWAFVLREDLLGTTRLVVRERYAYRRPWARFLVEPVEVASFVMSQKMLRGIRDRAEHAAAATWQPGR